MSRYLLTEDANCGAVVYDLEISSASEPDFNPLLTGLATLNDNLVTLTQLRAYPAGSLVFIVKISNKVDGMLTEPAYTKQFSIELVNKCHLASHADLESYQSLMEGPILLEARTNDYVIASYEAYLSLS